MSPIMAEGERLLELGRGGLEVTSSFVDPDFKQKDSLRKTDHDLRDRVRASLVDLLLHRA